MNERPCLKFEPWAHDLPVRWLSAGVDRSPAGPARAAGPPLGGANLNWARPAKAIRPIRTYPESPGWQRPRRVRIRPFGQATY